MKHGEACKASVRPVKVRFASDDLACQVVRGVGFRARGSCGWEGPTRDYYADARNDLRRHLRNHDAA